MKFNSSFGIWLRQRRKALDLTQQDLADQIGYSVMTIRKIEGDERRPSKQIAERLADMLAISLDERAAFIAFARPPANDPPSLPSDWTSLTPGHNLPLQSMLFVGRQNELTQIGACLGDPTCRLLTLVGPGGIGKTRLALEGASGYIEKFVGGVFFVSLTPVGSPGLIASAIASALKISFYRADDPNMQLVNYLSGKEILLILDNFEHLLEGIGLLTDLLANAPRLKILTTSRERLNMVEEWVLVIDGLPFPGEMQNQEVESYSAVQLFVQSARRQQPDFSLEDNQRGVIDICEAVEGMPLGIELAATWLRVMPCHQIAGQIRRSLDFLATPLRNMPERHRSLRAVFEHSWNLRSPMERSVLAKLSVFRGGFDLEAAEQVAETSLSLLAGLADKSLIRSTPTGRYDMHELFRQFVGDKLLESGEAAEIDRRHYAFFVSLAEQSERSLFGPEHIAWMDRLEVEHNNFRAALDWTSRTGDAEAGLRLASALGWFWQNRVYWNEGCVWLERLLAAANGVSISVRAKALHHMLELRLLLLGRDEHMLPLCDEALILAGKVENKWLTAWLLCSVAWIDAPLYARRQARFEEALALFKELGDSWGIGHTILRLGACSYYQGNFGRAGELFEEGIRLSRQANDKGVLAWLLYLSGFNAYLQGSIDQRVEVLYQESLTLFGELRSKHGTVVALMSLGIIALLRGHDKQAWTLFVQGLMLSQEVDHMVMICLGLVGLGSIFCAQGQVARAVRLFGAVEALVLVGYARDFNLHERHSKRLYERDVAAARAQLGDAVFAAAWAEGRAMTLRQAVAYALETGI